MKFFDADANTPRLPFSFSFISSKISIVSYYYLTGSMVGGWVGGVSVTIPPSPMQEDTFPSSNIAWQTKVFEGAGEQTKALSSSTFVSPMVFGFEIITEHAL